MRTYKKVFTFSVLCSILLIIPLAYSLGIVGNPSFVELTSSTATVFVDPDKIVKDYLSDPGYQIGDTLQIHVNISDAVDLYSWNVNMTWDPAMLNFTRIVSYGNFLAQTPSPYGTSRIVDITNVSNETGYAAIAESILGNYSGISGDGRLATIEFQIEGYGYTDLAISIAGTLPTKLLNSTDNSMPFTTNEGYFRNVISGDINGDVAGTPPDGDVDKYDFGTFAYAYGSIEGDPKFVPLADINGDAAGTPPDGDVDKYDFGTFAYNYGKTI